MKIVLPYTLHPTPYTPLSSQKAEGKKVCTVSFFTFVNWIVISAMLHSLCVDRMIDDLSPILHS
ncbi:MAG TPA: hypothetical protein V6D26_13975 [Stenomitos sp.]